MNSHDIEKTGRSRWPLIVTGMLAAHVGAMVLAVNIAGADGGNVVMPEYYDRAIGWDDHRRALARSERSGWSIDVTPAALANEDGTRDLRFLVRDESGALVDGARLSVRTWHHSIGELSESTARPSSERGVYVARTSMVRSGTWTCETAIDANGEAYVDERTVRIVGVDEGER